MYSSNLYEEEIDDECETGISIFPLSQFHFGDPCKKCLVKMMCNDWCENKFKEMNWRLYKMQISKNIKRAYIRYIMSASIADWIFRCMVMVIMTILLKVGWVYVKAIFHWV